MDILIEKFILKEIDDFAHKNKCCIHYIGPFCRSSFMLISKIEVFGLYSKIFVINGYKVTKIYKSYCNHSLHQTSSFQLSEQLQKEVLHYLKSSTYDGLQQDTLISSQIFRSVRSKPVVSPNRFTIGPLRQSIYQSSDTTGKEMLLESWRIFPYRKTILEKISHNRIVLINGDVSLEKSTAIPMFIVEDSSTTGTYCKILCVEADTLSAITHCTVLTKCIKERIGSRVGFQVYLQSRVCDNTNLIYTTAVFFLRVLMGQNYKDSFRHISHIVISDVHLHHAYTDILLQELKNILPYYSQIKIILLSDSDRIANFISYFGEGDQLQLNINLHDVKLHYIEEINLMIENDEKQRNSKQLLCNILPTVDFKEHTPEEWADKALEEYDKTGLDSALNKFLYFVNDENISINYTHSLLNYTALIVAAKHGNSFHINRLLIYDNINPFLQDKHKLNALEYAVSKNNADCVRKLWNFMKGTLYEYKPPNIDFRLIQKLVQLVTTSWKLGNILIILPTYEDLLKLSYSITKSQFIGKIPQKITIHLLHPNMQYDEIQPIIADSVFVKIILATKVAESLAYLNDITYVIDSSQNRIEKYHPESMCKELSNEWASKESLQRRSAIASRFTAGHCFRLIPRNLFTNLLTFSTPELLYMPMNRILLTVKLLCPYKMVGEYLQQTIIKPPLLHVTHSIGFLKKIEVFDCMEDVTWLGCRLIDVPINLELGKSLVLSILLKCLDPVLTIVSFLTCTDLKEIAGCRSSIAKTILDNEKKSVSDCSYSDHLTLLRLYQVWQNDKRENTLNEILNDEDTYVINGILDKVCGIRTHLVGALRSSQLIHNQGQLSMHSINSKANNWAVIKAALTAGLYPKLCMIDKRDYQLKSHSRQLCIHPSSTLKDLKKRTVNPLFEKYPSDWIVFFRETNSTAMNSISNCTLVSPITIALFGGKTEFNPENVLLSKDVGYAAFYIDEWIWLTTDINSALLVYKLRQRLYTIYLDFLQTCGNIEKWRKSNAASEIPRIFDLISNIVLEEDINNGFVQPTRVGNRPKAVASKFTSDFEIDIHPRTVTTHKKINSLLTSLNKNRCLDKEFFLISIFDSHEIMKSFSKQAMLDISIESMFDSIRSSASVHKLTFVIVSSLNQRRLTNVAVVKCHEGGFYLRNCFQVNIPVIEVIIVCTANKLTLPPFKPDENPLKLDNCIGELILDLL